MLNPIRRGSLWVGLIFTLTIISFDARASEVEFAAPQNIIQQADRWLEELGETRSFNEERIKVSFDGEFRYRLEYRDDFNLNNSTFEDDDIHLLRTRFGLKVQVDDHIRVYAQGQDSESFAGRREHRSTGFVNRLDLHQLYLELESPWEDLPVAVKVGRQELSYGDQRFVGAFGWSNVARVFDAAKIIFKPTNYFQADGWFSQVVSTNRSQPDSGAHNDNFYGLYTTLKPMDKHILDTFMFIRHSRDRIFAGELTGEVGPLKEYTVGNRAKGEKWGFDYGLEWAWQFGSRAHDDIRAWAWHTELGYTAEDLFTSPRISFEYNHGSGDSDSRDGTYENFDNLFPTNHMHYGFIDFASLRNTRNFKLGLDFKPHKKVKFSWAQHWFFLDTNNSAWFNAGQAPIRAASSGASTTVGQETDLFLKWQAMQHVEFLAGYSHFHAGAFVKDTGSADDANFVYFQTAIKV